MPYGEVIDPPTTQESVLFTGKPRDQESGLDGFGPRSFGSAMARWASPDDPFADAQLFQPDSWNRYAYVGNNPVRFLDINGRWKQEGNRFISWGKAMDRSGMVWTIAPFGPFFHHSVAAFHGYNNFGDPLDGRTYSASEAVSLTLSGINMALGSISSMWSGWDDVLNAMKLTENAYNGLSLSEQIIQHMRGQSDQTNRDYLIFLIVHGQFSKETQLTYDESNGCYTLEILPDTPDDTRNRIIPAFQDAAQIIDRAMRNDWHMPFSHRRLIDNGLTAKEEWERMRQEVKR